MWRGICIVTSILIGGLGSWGEALESVEPAEVVVLDVPVEQPNELDTSAAGVSDAVTAASVGFQEVWSFAPQFGQTDEIQIESAISPSYTLAAPIALEVVVHSEDEHFSAHGHLVISSADGTVINEGELPVDLVEGPNRMRFMWDASAAPTGSYTLRLEVYYLSDEPPAWMVVPLKKVTDLQLRQDLYAVTQDLALLHDRLEALSNEEQLPPYQHVRMVIARDFLAKAREHADQRDWHALDEELGYLTSVAQAMRVALSFGAVAPELQASIVRPSLQHLEVREGSFWADGRPVFLVGQTLSEADPGAVRALPRIALNFAAVDFGPERTHAGQAPELAAVLGDVLRAAQEQNVSVELRLAPHEINGTVLSSHPEVALADRSIDIASDPARLAYQSHVAAIAPLVSGQPALTTISLAEDPWFYFRGDKVRARFIEFAKEIYPTRHKLNESWRSHLGSYDDIVIEETTGYDLYLEKRAFQADWQAFTRSLGMRYLDWAAGLVSERLPGVPLQVTLGDNLFEKAESRRGLSRETVAERFTFLGCSSTTEPTHPVYAYDYPVHVGYYTLMRSLAPDKPLLNSEDYFVIDDAQTPEQRFHYVRAAVWDAFVSGLSAMAVPDNSPLFAHPETVEAFATVAMDVNRLSPVVHALQQAPAPIAVLWSGASKIFDDGDPYLESALYAYEGCSFSGYNTRWISEEQCASGELANVKLLVIPHTPAVTDAAFNAMKEYIEAGGVVARIGMPIPYNEKGHSRQDILRNSYNTILVRGVNLPTEYLHAIDAAIEMDALPVISRPVNEHGYPLEGVRTRTVEVDGEQYLYLVNVRKEPVTCHLTGPAQGGRDLIQGRDIVFPFVMNPMEPLLLRMNRPEPELLLTAPAIPVAAVQVK